MTILLYICIAIWLAKAIAQILLGILQIIGGLALCILGTSLYVLAHVTELLVDIWRAAFSTNNTKTINKHST